MVQTELNQREILEKDFASKLRGYDPQEVDEFLDMIIRDYKVFDNHIDELTEENERLTKNSTAMFKRLVAATNKIKALTKEVETLREKQDNQAEDKVEAPSDSKSAQAGDQEEVHSYSDLKEQQAKLVEKEKQESQQAAKEEPKEEAEDMGKTRVVKSPLKIKNPIASSQPEISTRQAQDQPEPQASSVGPDSDAKTTRSSATILDLLKRVSNLEKAVFGEKMADN